jgi:hypothetical protein
MSSALLPKVIWFLWLQGLEQAPEIVRLCLDSWRRLNPGWEVRTLDRAALDGLIDLSAIPAANLESASPQALSDIARVRLLAAHGGVWADASVFCTQPLDDWLRAELGGGFFAFTAPGRDRLISTWFLASMAGGPLVSALDKAVLRYWSGPAFENDRRPRLARGLEKLFGGNVTSTRLWFTPAVREGLRLRPYFWLHYLFAETLRRDPEAAAAWASAGKRPADGPHRLQARGMDTVPGAELRAEIEGATQPMYKLDLRRASAAVGTGGALDELLVRHRAQFAADLP